MDNLSSKPIDASTSMPEHGISFADAVRVWLKIALLSFGGPAGQIANHASYFGGRETLD